MANEIVAGTLLPSTRAQAHAVTASLGAEFVELTLCNVHATDPADYQIWFKPDGVAIADEHRIFNTTGNYSLGAGESVSWPMWPMLDPADEIHWQASSANRIAAHLSIRETTPGSSQENFDADYLTASLATLWTVPSGVQCTLAWLAFCNHNTTAEKVELQAIPNGQSAGDQYKVVSHRAGGALQPGQTRFIKLHPYWTAGYFLQAKADTADKVTAYGGFYVEAV